MGIRSCMGLVEESSIHQQAANFIARRAATSRANWKKSGKALELSWFAILQLCSRNPATKQDDLLIASQPIINE